MRKAIDGLVRKLGLTPPDAFTQDWECEVCDANRCKEWLDAYESMPLTGGEKFALMYVIVESMNDAIRLGKSIIEVLPLFETCLRNDAELHRQILEDYCNWDEDDPESMAAITPLLREIAVELRLDIG